MNVVVCIKQVPHPDHLARITLDPETGTVRREGIPAIINPSDRNALEEALRVKENHVGTVTALTAGPPAGKKVLEEALAMGADNAVHLCDPTFAGADTLATAQTLAYGIRNMAQYDLVLCGDATIDSGTGQVAVQLAELLSLPAVTNVAEITVEEDGCLVLKRVWERGFVRVRTRCPAVIGVTANINQPRLATLTGIMAATQKTVTCWNAADINAESACVGLDGSPTQFYQLSEFHAKRQGELLEGSPEDVVSKTVARLTRLEIL